MPYFSDREQGPKPRIVEKISHDAWGGIIAIIKSRITNGSFGYRYPSGCPDGEVSYGCDENSFSQALKAEIPDIDWPLKSEQVPPTLSVLDLLELCYQSVGKPVAIDYHPYYKHNHLRFEREEGQIILRNDVNRIFARNGLTYELDHSGHILRLPPEVLGEVLNPARFKTGDDAWERLKTIETGKGKKESITALLNKAASEPMFRDTLEEEAMELTRIGNTFRIRHSETGQVSLECSEHVDYLFHRLYALIHMLLQVRE